MSSTNTSIPPDQRMLADIAKMVARLVGQRLTRAEMCERLGVHRNTFVSKYMADPEFPKPGKDGKWLLEEVIDWEHRK
jgi:hypothetical protein